LTKSTYIIVTANVFALMGLRQLYFLLGGLMERLIYLTKGLSIILAFIGVKLVFEAAIATHHEKVLGVTVPEISLHLSLGVIIGTLILTAILSLYKSRGHENSSVDGVQDGKSEAH
jgi:tellurite resistance protein TerC